MPLHDQKQIDKTTEIQDRLHNGDFIEFARALLEIEPDVAQVEDLAVAWDEFTRRPRLPDDIRQTVRDLAATGTVNMRVSVVDLVEFLLNHGFDSVAVEDMACRWHVAESKPPEELWQIIDDLIEKEMVYRKLITSEDCSEN